MKAKKNDNDDAGNGDEEEEEREGRERSRIISKLCREKKIKRAETNNRKARQGGK